MELLKKIPMPDNMEKGEIIDLLLREEYGYLPKDDVKVSAELIEEDKKFCAGKAVLHKLRLTCKGDFGEFSFPVMYSKQLSEGKKPCFIHINFSPNVPDKYQPTEEIVDHGYSILSFFYQDVTSDDDDFTNGLAGVIYPDGKRGEYDCGKIGLWAWAAMRVMDYAQTLPEIDSERITVAGHSRLGKTALLAGMLDERFFCAVSNNSGSCGAAISREKDGETIADICRVFPFWFSKHYLKYCNNEDNLPFDQHYLLAANYPHLVYVASAEGDIWAGPKNEYLSCIAASGYFEKRGKTGFVHPDRLAEVGEAFHDGSIGYHYRTGTHFQSRYDWVKYIEFLNKH
ncbi:MAG: hypothetical protein E7406_06045 [Ruminococcaceae bacterium]|nr:hypothetical protein [Oscillospiraceae bacterium]